MLTYLIYKEFIYEILIKDLLLDGNSLEIASSIIAIPIYVLIGLWFIVADILLIPFYLLIGIICLIVRLIRGD